MKAGRSAPIKFLLPVLDVLRKLKPDQRMILLAHLDDSTRDGLYRTIAHVLKANKVPMETKLRLKRALGPFKKEFRYLADKDKPAVRKKKTLAQVGGKPMGLVLKTAVPLLLDIFQS